MVGLMSRIGSLFSATGNYDALEPRRRRRNVASRIQHEDELLPSRRRDQLASTTQDGIKNFEVLGWVVRKHLDYVTRFSFQGATDDELFNTELEQFMSQWSKRINCDTARRHSLRRQIRIWEARRTIDGDVGILKVRGGRLQTIEGDKIRDPDDRKMPRRHEDGTAPRWVNGVRVTPDLRALAYGLHKRVSGGNYDFIKTVSERDMWLHACYDALHRVDQVRGISPIQSSLNRARDVYESFEYALAKIKIAQLFGLKITKEIDGSGEPSGYGDETDEDGDGKYDVSFGRGPFKLELDAGDDADFLEAKTPASETRQFMELMIAVVLKSLDIPYSFFDEAHTNFYGSRGGLLQYLRSAKQRIEDNQELLNEIAQWRLGIAVATGELTLPVGMRFTDVAFEWVPEGVPWWDPAKEVKGHKEAIGSGLSNPQLVCRQTGTDFFANIDAIQAAQEYAAARGVTLSFETQTEGAFDVENKGIVTAE